MAVCFPIPVTEFTASYTVNKRNFLRHNCFSHLRKSFFHVSAWITQQRALSCRFLPILFTTFLEHQHLCFFSPYINRKHYLVLPYVCNYGVHCKKSHSPYGTNKIGSTINFFKYNVFIINEKTKPPNFPLGNISISSLTSLESLKS